MNSAGRVLPIPKGTWDSATSYTPLDFVYYGGNSYVCKSAVTSSTAPDIDTTHWQVMASGFDISMFEHLEEDIAPIEETTTASQNYAVGEYLFNGGQLYIVSTAITAGDTLTPGTNITAAVLGDDVAALKAEADGTASDLATTAANLATVEATSTASKAYSVGDYLVYNGILYKVTASIANGGTITPGTNVTQDTVGGELTSIKESLATRGVYYSDTFDTTSISGNSAQNKVAEMSLPAGVYVINASCQWASSFTEVTGMYFDGIGSNSVVRGTGAGGGGLNITAVVELLATTAVSVYVFQASSSSKSINQTRFAAVKLS